MAVSTHSFFVDKDKKVRKKKARDSEAEILAVEEDNHGRRVLKNNRNRDDSSFSSASFRSALSGKSGKSKRSVTSEGRRKSRRSITSGVSEKSGKSKRSITSPTVKSRRSINLSITEEEMTSKQKKKNIVEDDYGVSWVVDEAGNKIKKVRKKVRGRNSVGNAGGYGTSGHTKSLHSRSEEFAGCGEDPSPEADDDYFGALPDGKMISFRTASTDKSSSHDSLSASLSTSEKLENSGHLSTSSRKIKKAKNIVEIDGQLWRTDDEGNPLNKVRRKGTKDVDRLSQTDHGPTSSPSKPSSSSSNKKKKRNLSKGSKSVRHFSHSDNIGYSSGEDQPTAGTAGTDGTTGTGSVHARPAVRRSLSQPEMKIDKATGRPEIKRQRSGDLDLLMSQSVHDHTRKGLRSADKTSLSKPRRKSQEKRSIGKALGKLFKGKSKDKDKDSMRSTVDERLAEMLPKNVREIDGILWRVDPFGNKLNKVREQSSTSEEPYVTQSEEMIVPLSGHSPLTNDSDHKSISNWDTSSHNSFDDYRSLSTMDSGAGRKSGRNRRKNTADNDFSECSYKKQDSDSSLYLDASMNDALNKPSRRKNRLQSLDRGDSDDEPMTASNGDGSGHDQGDLLRRLRTSEQEVSRLLKVTSDQQDAINDAEKVLKKMKKKLKQANLDKEDLAEEIDRMGEELEEKEKLLLKERNRPKPQQQTNNNNNRGNSGSDRLVAQICELKQKKFLLEKQMDEDQARSEAKLEAKEAEIEFLQEELDRMRAEKGDRQLQRQITKSSNSDDEDTAGMRPSNLVGKILGNHLQHQAETRASLQQQEIRDLQDRVCQLQISNEKLKTELRDASLAIKDDDDEEMRMAKEAAALAVSCHNAPSSKMARRGSNGSMISESFRMQRRGSNGGGSVAPDGFRMPRRGSNPDQAWWGR